MTDTIIISSEQGAVTLISPIVAPSIIISVGEQGPPGTSIVSPIIHLSGDVTALGNTGDNIVVTLADTAVTEGTYGSSSTIPVITVDSKGRITSATSANLSLSASVITSGILATAILPAFTGDITTTEGTSATTLKNSGVTAGNYSKVEVNSKGIVTAGTNPTNILDLGVTNVYNKTEVDSAIYNSTPSFTTLRDKPISLAGYGIYDAYTKAETDALIGSGVVSWSTLTGKPNTISGYNITDAVSTSMIGSTIASLVSGKIPASQLPSYVDDVLEGATLAAFPAIGETGKIYVALDTNLTYRWSGSAYVFIGGVTTDAALLTSGVLNSARLPALTGSDVSMTAGSGVLILSTTGVTAGSYKVVTVDTKGRVTGGNNPTTLAGFGITDAQATLVSGSNIKTINGVSLLGSGDIVITGSGTGTVSFADLTNIPTTIVGYGITDAYTKTEINTNFYTKTEVNTNNYTKTEVNTNFYTKSQVDSALASISVISVKSYNIFGSLVPNVGSTKWFPHKNIVINGGFISVGTQSSSIITVNIKLNGSVQTSMSLPANSSRTSLQTLNITVTTNDYISVDVTTTGGANLTLTLEYL